MYGVAKKAEHLCRAARYLIVLRVVLALVNGVLLAVVWRWMDKFRANGDDENVLYCIAIIVVLAIETVESFLSAAVFWLPKILQTA